MFGRAMKHKITCLATCIALGAVCLYHGMSCIITLGKAYKQPYLLSGSDRFAFTGSYMMAAMHGGVCILLIVILSLLVRRKRKTRARDADSWM